jgi:hypothetical protein
MKWLLTLLAGAVFGAAAMFFYLYKLPDGSRVSVPTQASSGPAVAYPPPPPAPAPTQ